MPNKVAVIGGSGAIADSPAFQRSEWVPMHTQVAVGQGDGMVEYLLRDDGVIFIPRHGHSVGYGPAATQYAANIVAACMLNATVVIATSAVGSLTDRIKVRSLVVPDDYIDETRRSDNLFGKGFVVHANPRPAFSPQLREILLQSADGIEFDGIHDGGKYVAIPGDRFGTSAEGKRRAQYADIVGMTVCPEASLAMQAGLHYAVAAFPVDVDSDANHEHGTLKVMQDLSRHDLVPAYIERAVERAKALAFDPPPLPQLRGNIICHSLDDVKNTGIRKIAERLKKTYFAKE